MTAGTPQARKLHNIVEIPFVPLSLLGICSGGEKNDDKLVTITAAATLRTEDDTH